MYLIFVYNTGKHTITYIYCITHCDDCWTAAAAAAAIANVLCHSIRPDQPIMMHLKLAQCSIFFRTIKYIIKFSLLLPFGLWLDKTKQQLSRIWMELKNIYIYIRNLNQHMPKGTIRIYETYTHSFALSTHEIGIVQNLKGLKNGTITIH